MRNLFYIFIGGGAGSIARFLVSSYTQKFLRAGNFPFGTLAVNMFGCILIGFLLPYLSKSDSYLKFLLVTGFCGGFTTFSAFSVENYTLWQNQELLTLFIYIILSITIGIASVFLGVKLNAAVS